MPDQAAIDLWIITGFLGSGKTSVLNSLLDSRAERRIGVVVNDFGSLGIDASLLPEGTGSPIVELNGGQIFCACLSGSFVKSLVELTDRGVDAILVESSGLAKPRPMTEIIEEAVKRTAGVLRYRGMIGVVDAVRVLKLRAAVNAVDEQLLFSDLIVINKCDLADDKQLEEVTESIGELCPNVPTRNATHGELDWSALPGGREGPDGQEQTQSTESGRVAAELDQYGGWGEPGRPVVQTVVPDGKVTRSELEAFARRLGQKVERSKGYVESDEGHLFLSVSGDQFEIRTVDQSVAPGLGLTVIAPARVNIPELVRGSFPHASVGLLAR